MCRWTRENKIPSEKNEWGFSKYIRLSLLELTVIFEDEFAHLSLKLTNLNFKTQFFVGSFEGFFVCMKHNNTFSTILNLIFGINHDTILMIIKETAFLHVLGESFDLGRTLVDYMRRIKANSDLNKLKRKNFSSYFLYHIRIHTRGCSQMMSCTKGGGKGQSKKRFCMTIGVVRLACNDTIIFFHY